MGLLNSEIDISRISLDSVGNILVAVLYQFRNAFPIVLRCFLFIILAVLRVSMLYRNALMSVHSRITAYSSGIGDGSCFFNLFVGLRLAAISALFCYIDKNPSTDGLN